MTYNDILRRFRYAVDLSNSDILECFNLIGHSVSPERLHSFFKRETESGYQELPAELMNAFLNGLIIFTRGRKENDADIVQRPQTPLSNNVILKKIRIALELREDDMLNLLDTADFSISRSELSALFRKKGHKNYKECGDQLLRNFINGLTQHNRIKQNKVDND
ncbi:MAG: DUF1456 family protein [Deltaproteobacteria bacterium]|nr:DUF1456 family protein [Deltaproteobacteria bacterium]